MNVSVFGLGYVGCVSIGCIAASGHKVIGVDVKEEKVDQVNSGVPTIFEPGLDDLMKKSHAEGLICATTSVEYAVANSTVSLVTVGTPSSPNGDLNLTYIYRVAENIGKALKGVDHVHTVAIRSTVKPGTCDKVIDLIEETSGKKVNEDFYVVSNPEFLREGTAIQDYMKPPYVLVGADHQEAFSSFRELYGDLEAEIYEVSLKTVEVIKYINNSWHALKVAFGNEVGAVCKELGIDSQEVMRLFVKDTSLNISSNYLRPGFAYGGSCLPKDLSGFLNLASSVNVSSSLLEGVGKSNKEHINRAIDLIKLKGEKKLSFYGATFKEGTDDVRNSPSLEVINALLKEGYDVKVFDRDVNLAISEGRNLATLKYILGDVAELLVDNLQDLENHSPCMIIAKSTPEIKDYLASNDNREVLDLVFLGNDFRGRENYHGLAW